MERFTKSTNNVFILNNGTKICKWCGKELKESKMFEDYGGYDIEEIPIYSCECSEWSNYIDNIEEFNNKLESLNKEFAKQHNEYLSSISKLCNEYKHKLTNEDLDNIRKYELWYKK